MKFERITDTEYVCRSDSGAVYDLTAEPIPDEFESAMRCGISPADEFVQQIPRVWSCDCPAARRGLDCKHIRAFFREVLGYTDARFTEEGHAAKIRADSIARARARREAEKNHRQAEAARDGDRAAFVGARDNPECIAAARELIRLRGERGDGAAARFSAAVAAFERRWGFIAYDTRLTGILWCAEHGRQPRPEGQTRDRVRA
jgi:hypothetical protein